ncbi:TetR/AcrR family transcriptional regulator C-terminal domain-containing protein [uncultured Microbacterium sp.]|uniref:TetR/AcrR family transcriptional regulator C-terminal domain-containing protein n=1 Tax=uncultured Microbacterium sp. TaxID=191216 RepID=UPI0028D2C165|nr:TetR/AcrR family transcriptional regulator C-terminal domain-containing protein [uncultured Microbacterium sp.]
MTDTDGVKPRRGRPRLVDREKIIRAARLRDPATLTMQALAEDIGVDRKTLHYHVENRTSLMRMVAADAFRDAVSSHDFTEESDWRTAIHSFAHITRDAVTAAGAWASYVEFDSEEDLEAVRPAEAATVALVNAGLAEADAGRVITMLAELAFASARAISDTAARGTAPQEELLERALEKVPAGQFALTRRLLGNRSTIPGGDEHFSFQLEVVTLGVEKLLEVAGTAS